MISASWAVARALHNATSHALYCQRSFRGPYPIVQFLPLRVTAKNGSFTVGARRKTPLHLRYSGRNPGSIEGGPDRSQRDGRRPANPPSLRPVGGAHATGGSHPARAAAPRRSRQRRAAEDLGQGLAFGSRPASGAAPQRPRDRIPA